MSYRERAFKFLENYPGLLSASRVEFLEKEFAAIAEEAIQKERDACAKIADHFVSEDLFKGCICPPEPKHHLKGCIYRETDILADQIRSRSKVIL